MLIFVQHFEKYFTTFIIYVWPLLWKMSSEVYVFIYLLLSLTVLNV